MWGVRIANISGPSLDNSLRWPSSLSSTEVSLRTATISNSELLLSGWPPTFLSIDRTENVAVGPPLNTQLNSFVSSDVMAFFHKLCLCAWKHTCFSHLHPLLGLLCEHSGGFRLSHEGSIWHSPYGKWVQTGSFVFPDGLVPFGSFPFEISFFRLLSSVCSFQTENGIFSLSLFPFLLTSCLKLHESPPEHGPFEVHGLQPPCLRSLIVSCALPLWLPLGFPFQAAAPWRDLCSLRASKHWSLIFCPTWRRTMSFDREALAFSPFFLEYILQIQSHESFQILGDMVLFLVQIFQYFLHRAFWSWREVLRRTWCRSLAHCHSSTVLSVDRWSQEELRLFHWSWSCQRQCKQFVFHSGIDCPVVSFPLPSWSQRSTTSWEHSLFLKSSTSMSGSIGPNVELDDFNSSMFPGWTDFFDPSHCFLLNNLSWSKLHFWSSSSKSRIGFNSGISRTQFYRLLSSSGHHCSVDYFVQGPPLLMIPIL